MATFVISDSKELISQDWKKWLHNSLVFLVPVAIVFLGELIKIVPEDWQFGALALYFINVVIDLVRKWANTNTYRK